MKLRWLPLTGRTVTPRSDIQVGRLVSFSRTEEEKKKSTTVLGVMYADFFFFSHPPLDHHRGDRRNERGCYIPRLFHCHPRHPIFVEEQKERILEKEEWKERKIRISYKIHSRSVGNTRERRLRWFSLKLAKGKGENDHFRKWADGSLLYLSLFSYCSTFAATTYVCRRAKEI